MSIPSCAQSFDAPAKLNLFLHIIGQRADGYHLLETVFTLIDLKDKIYLAPREDGQIILHSDTPASDKNQDLSVRAATLLKQKTACPLGADIWLEKNIPVGAGLGGGSSDAATVLMALNHLWQTNIPRIQLGQWALALGADVPFFIFGQSAFAQGVGEELTPIDIPERYYVLLYPEVAISTQAVFSHKALTRNTPSCIIRGLGSACMRKNDMQGVVMEEYPQVAQAIAALQPFGCPLMSGSGSSVFLECETEEKAKEIYQKVCHQFKAFWVKGLALHPHFNLL